MKIKQYIDWILLWWPLILVIEILLLHIGLIDAYSLDSQKVNRFFGLVMQLAGGLFVLISIDSNLHLFASSSIFDRFCRLVKSFPRKIPPVTLFPHSSVHGSSSTEATLSVPKELSTIDEKIEYLQFQIDDLRSSMSKNVNRLDSRISSVHDQVSTEIRRLDTDFLSFQGKVREMGTSGLDIQIFGVFLVIYGSISAYIA